MKSFHYEYRVVFEFDLDLNCSTSEDPTHCQYDTSSRINFCVLRNLELKMLEQTISDKTHEKKYLTKKITRQNAPKKLHINRHQSRPFCGYQQLWLYLILKKKIVFTRPRSEILQVLIVKKPGRLNSVTSSLGEWGDGKAWKGKLAPNVCEQTSTCVCEADTDTSCSCRPHTR